ncbi:MAG TPA: 5-(carboxyamino)imidazole ribonucleotide mutase, partial [Microthrixaceae bacterium]|nr:5-(carboxyamino)imidazole ribonucleotide mutase [Microthrixaceae bacterium]
NITVGIIMGSSSDLPTMREASVELERFGVAHEVRVISAHRSPVRMVEYAKTAADRGLSVVIAGAGGAAHLPGMVASLTTLPVIGVPIATRNLGGVDSLHSIVQMPGGVPVATMSIGGARNAGLLAVRILAVSDERLAALLVEDQMVLEQHAVAQDDEVRAEFDSSLGADQRAT